MNKFKIAVAQISSVKGNIEANITTHLKAIKKASELGVSYIVFPELSLTGYEPELSAELSFSIDDKCLQPLVNSAIENNIQIGVGAPIMTEGLPQIGLVIISQSGDIEIYAKMHLHHGEDLFFSKGENIHCITVNKIKIANAICADVNNSEHINSYYKSGASVYIAGDWTPIGRSAIWSDTGLIASANETQNAIVMAEKTDTGWVGSVFEISS